MGLNTLSPSEINSSLTTTPESAANMTKGNTDLSKGNKRKGTRSVSTLTPSQLARKRANDREAQRAIRARTKEHIENLERQIEELRGQQGRDRVVQELLRRNKALEDELRRLRESLGLPSNNISTVPSGVYQSTASYSGTCTRTPPFCSTAPEYQSMPDGGNGSYGNMNESNDAWHQASMQGSIPSVVSSPSSRDTDDYGSHNYIAASMAPTMMGRASIPPAMDSVMSSPRQSTIVNKGDFEDIKSEFGGPPVSVVPLTPTFQAQQPWSIYPMYYSGSPAAM